jgi:hypothetical protein
LTGPIVVGVTVAVSVGLGVLVGVRVGVVVRVGVRVLVGAFEGVSDGPWVKVARSVLVGGIVGTVGRLVLVGGACITAGLTDDKVAPVTATSTTSKITIRLIANSL